MRLVRPDEAAAASASASAWRPPPFDLGRQPQRPGELCHELALPTSLETAHTLEERAAREGVPLVLSATLGIEAARVVAAVTNATGELERSVIAALDSLAEAAQSECESDPGCRTRLTDYGRALGAAPPRPAAAVLGGLVVRPSMHVFTAWSRMATERGEAVEVWAAGMLEHAPAEAVGWEAAAAASGESILEWALAHAARRRRSLSTAAQSRA